MKSVEDYAVVFLMFIGLLFSMHSLYKTFNQMEINTASIIQLQTAFKTLQTDVRVLNDRQQALTVEQQKIIQFLNSNIQASEPAKE